MFIPFPDARKALWRAVFLHFPMSAPFALAALAVPSAGKWYLGWREKSEMADEADGSDSPAKAAMDYWSQTALVKLALKARGSGE